MERLDTLSTDEDKRNVAQGILQTLRQDSMPYHGLDLFVVCSYGMTTSNGKAVSRMTNERTEDFIAVIRGLQFDGYIKLSQTTQGKLKVDETIELTQKGKELVEDNLLAVK